jgi:hypothetical protein
VADAADGGITLTLQVCLDRALESWILSFGPAARVVSPSVLEKKIGSQLQQGAAQYR